MTKRARTKTPDRPRVDAVHLMRRPDDQQRHDTEAIGIEAAATVSYPIGARGERRLERLHSGGLWGIDADSDDNYLAIVEAEQLSDLREHLERFGIDCDGLSTWAEHCRRAKANR